MKLNLEYSLFVKEILTMTTLQPGYTNTGYQCQHCVKSQKKYNTFCSIPSHHKSRVMKQKLQSKTSKFTLETITRLTEEYSALKLIVSTVLLFPEIDNLDGVIKFSSKIKTHQLNSYLVNLHLTKDKTLLKNLELAKSITGYFPHLQEVKIVNQTVHSKTKLSVDLITRNLQNELCGIMIPHNYYLLRLSILAVINLTPEDSLLKEKLLAEYGFNRHYYQPLVTDSNAKDAMCYAPSKNPYWERIIYLFHQNKAEILNKLVSKLTFSTDTYPIFLLSKKGITPLINTMEGWDIKFDTEYTRKPSLKFWITHQNNPQYRLYVGWEKNYILDPQITIMKI